MKRLAIIGWEEGIAGQLISWIHELDKFEVVCFVHPYPDHPIIDETVALNRPATQFSFPKNGFYLEKPLIYGFDWKKKLESLKIEDVVITNSNVQERHHIKNQITESGYIFESVIHPSAQILNERIIGKGCIIEPLTYIGYRAEIGDFVHLHVGAKIDHQSVIQSFVNVLPGSTIAGNSLIGKFSTINMGAIIANRVEIGENCIVGAGSVVLKSFPAPNQKLLGSPAKAFT